MMLQITYPLAPLKRGEQIDVLKLPFLREI